MITDIFIKIFIFILDIVKFALPSWNLEPQTYAGLTDFVQKIVQFNEFIPTYALIYTFVMIISFELTILIIKATSGFISIIRGGGKLDID